MHIHLFLLGYGLLQDLRDLSLSRSTVGGISLRWEDHYCVRYTSKSQHRIESLAEGLTANYQVRRILVIRLQKPLVDF